jgi:mono/diheme cytochrome c family protein
MRTFLKYFFALYVLGFALVVGLAGFRGSRTTKPPIEVFPDMDRQPKLRPQTTTKFPRWADGQSSRVHPVGTVSRESAWEDNAFNTGKQNGAFVEANPVPVTSEILKRGQERYAIYCQPCHGAAGDGKGVTSRYGMGNTASLHQDRLVKTQDGDIFNTIGNGKSTMIGYASAIPVADRWAVVAFVRALQLSRLAAESEVPASVLPTIK